jgi:predicted SnoaL-like aldol condensation-catalyzing enzyme
MRFIAGAICISLCFLHGAAVAQSSGPPACSASPAQLEANKKLVLEFFTFAGTPEEQAKRFLTEDYIQHNPRLLRMDEITGARGRAAWLLGFREALRRKITLADFGGVQLNKPAIVMAECDLVTAIFTAVLADPDRPGHTYQAFVFETFRIRDGQLAEHWDQVRLEKKWMEGSAAGAAANP